MNHTWTFGLAILSSTVLVSISGCGKDDEKAGMSRDMAAMAAHISSPAGTISDGGIARAIGELFAVKLEGAAMAPSGAVESMDCSVSGSVTGSANAEGTSITFTYNDCCELENCCFDGPGWITQDADGFMLCTAFNLDINCEETAGSYNVEYCQDEDGEEWYLVEYGGETFACAGYYDPRIGGRWRIRDANDVWECKANCFDDICTGSCTDGAITYVW